SEVDSHDYPSRGGPAHLGITCVGEDAAAADVQFAPAELLARLVHQRVPLDCSGAAITREVDGGAGERSADTPLAKTGAGDETGDSPHSVVGFVFVAVHPGNPHPGEAQIGGVRFDGT